MVKEVCIVLPALNEEESIGKVIDEIPGAVAGISLPMLNLFTPKML